ncbi:site-specific integrase [Mycobacterium sp. 1245852.3]|uniref:tyrosine-type recombinase/integrase n=1 Tax=Mycobacterium sp. 1245852.3 TaxID=1856860 RepID=UPI0007FBC7DB|nr:site-specific integrase [Mycobacterium sp. 1245852.3]OBJ98360.1 integrase [Mycobacterium sp. 1245852.3]
MASIRQRVRKDGSPYWSVLYVLDGRQTSSSFNDPQEAVDFQTLANKTSPAKALEVWAAKGTVRNVQTLASWCLHHVDHLTGVNDGTRAKYRSYIANDIAPSKIGSLPLTALTNADVAAWLNTLTGSAKTAANKHGFLAGALNAAVRARRIQNNPCDGNRLRRDEPAEMVFLTHAEFAILLAEVTQPWRPLVEFLAATGCRWGEASALRPADVDLGEGTVRIQRAWRYVSGEGYQLGPPKTRRSTRTVDVAPATLGKLDLSGEWVFTNSGRGRRGDTGPVRAHNFHPNVWVPAVARAKDKDLTKSPRVHDLRHSNASWLIQGGVPLPVIQRHLGHESIQTTVDRYGHLDRRSSRVVADVVGKALKTAMEARD